MKPVSLYVTDEISIQNQIQTLENKIPLNIRSSDEYIEIFHQIELCIEDFNNRLINLNQNGSSIQIEKSFKLKSMDIKIILEYPRRNLFFNKIREFF